MCGKIFISQGPYNRRCSRCQRKINLSSDSSSYIPKMYSFAVYNYNNEMDINGDFLPWAS